MSDTSMDSAQSFGNLPLETQKKFNAILKENLDIELRGYKNRTLYNEEGEKALQKIREIANIQKNLNKDTKSFVEYIKKIKKLDDEISQINDVMNKIEASKLNKSEAETKELNKQLRYLVKQKNIANDQKNLIAEQLKGINKLTLGAKMLGVAFSTALPNIIQGSYAKVKNLGLFQMDKAIKNSAMSMGILGKQSNEFADGIKSAAKDTIQFGVGIEDMAEMQGTYSDNLGRAVVLSKEGSKNIAAMSVATGLGKEGAAAMAASMDTVGFSAERTGKYVEQIMNDSHAMGLNSSKVIKTIAANIKLLNRYNFKNGAKGLAAMAEETAKMGVEMGIAAPMADKLFDIEGAVEMSAQLQVLGGEWSKLADPFKLMYMARNDVKGLTESVINATKASASFNNETKQFDIAPLEMQRLRKIAEATGMDFEQLAQSAKKAAQYAEIKKQISYQFDEKTEKFIEGTAMLDENKKATILVDGSPKFISQLTEADKQMLSVRAKDAETMAQRALNNRTFDDALNNTITLFKQSMLPLVEVMNHELIPKVDKFIQRFKDEKWGEKIGELAKVVGGVVSSIGGFILEWPKLSASLYLASKAVGLIADVVTWTKNGQYLAEGFLMTTKGAGGVAGGGALGRAKSTLPYALGLGAAGLGVGALTGAFTDKGSTANVAGNTLSGALGGAAMGAEIGSIFPGLGNVIGGVVGAIGGGVMAYLNAKEDQTPTKSMNDGIIKFHPNDKFMKVDDSTMIAGTNKNGNKDLANVLSGGIPSIGNTSGLSNGSRGGQINAGINSGIPGNLNVNLGNLTINGTIELRLGQNTSTEFSKELLNDPIFLRNMSRLVTLEVQKAANMGKHG